VLHLTEVSLQHVVFVAMPAEHVELTQELVIVPTQDTEVT